MKRTWLHILGFAGILIMASLLLMLLMYNFADIETTRALLLPIIILATVCFAYGLAVLTWHDKLLRSNIKYITSFNMVVGVSRLLIAAIGLGLYAFLTDDKSHLLHFTACLVVFYFITVVVMTHHCVKAERQQTGITQ